MAKQQYDEMRKEDRTTPSSGSGEMTVEEAGHKGGQRVRELVEEGKEKESEGGRSDQSK